MNNKELEKKQEKQKKVNNILKWCGIGLIGAVLAFGFFGLLAVGVKGCVSKQQLKQQQEETNMVLPNTIALKGEPHKYDKVDYYVNASYVDVYYDYPPLWSFLGGSTENMRQSLTYKWNYETWEASGQEVIWSYYMNCYTTSTQALGTAHAIGLNLDRTIQVYSFGYYGSGFYFSSITNPSSMNSNNTMYLSAQDMEEGYITNIEFTTYDIFTPEFLNSDGITIKYYQYNQGNFNRSAQDFITLNFELIRNAPTYVNGNNGLEGGFSLLYQAFTSLGSILQLQVVGGITLGTLVFIPLIIGLILFIVSLFKR